MPPDQLQNLTHWLDYLNQWRDQWFAVFQAFVMSDAKATKEELQTEIHELRQMVVAQQMTLNHLQLAVTDNPVRFQGIREEIRGLWNDAENYDQATIESLTVLHGLAERCTFHNQRTIEFFEKHVRLIRSGAANSIAVEVDATDLGLPVRDADEAPVDLTCQFGYVNAIEDGVARVSMMEDDKAGVSYVIEVPVNWLPKAYRDDTARVAWVERCYPSGVKGRFEPASGGPLE